MFQPDRFLRSSAWSCTICHHPCVSHKTPCMPLSPESLGIICRWPATPAANGRKAFGESFGPRIKNWLDFCLYFVSILGMLIVSGKSRAENRRDLARQIATPLVPVGLAIQRSRLELESQIWREYWRPCRPFFGVDLRLVQRLNRLKKAWGLLLQKPSDRVCQMTYCWRYFGLLHHAMRIAYAEPKRPRPIDALETIIGFESFTLRVPGEAGRASCTIASRNPIFLLGQLAVDPTVPTPRHVPLLRPRGPKDLFYHYRQLQISGTPSQRVLVCPAVELPSRASSFVPIDRLNRLVSERPDPYWKPRARLLARRILSPLLRARGNDGRGKASAVSILDLAAGTGHLLAKSWTYLARLADSLPAASFHFVDANPPSFGRSFGLSRDRAGVTHVEWTTANYRALADDEAWLEKNGPFDWVFACRILDNASNFMVEPIESFGDLGEPLLDCLPHRCLAPHAQPEGIRRLLVSTVKRECNGGVAYPQFSLRDYFAAIQALQNNSLHTIDSHSWYLPVRRFNPAALITPSGRSLLAQLMKVSQAVIVEDVDAGPEHLRQHKAEFGLAGTAAIYCTNDGFRTEANQFVVTTPDRAACIRGERLW